MLQIPMENGAPIVGIEEGTIDVQCLLQDGPASMDNGLCFNENIPQNAMDIEEVSCNFGVSTTDTGQEMDDILNSDVLHSMQSEDVGYLRLQNEFCSISDEYLLGSEFVESIGNMGFGSGEGLQSSVSETLALESCAGIVDTSWKSDFFRMGMPECRNDQLTIDGSGFDEIPDKCPELEPLVEEKPSRSNSSSALEDVGKFQSMSTCSFQDVLSDEADTSFLPSAESRKDEEFSLSGKSTEADGRHEESSLAMASQPSSVKDDHHIIQKRSRKPTQRYIDEYPDPVVRQYKKRRMASSSTPKDRPENRKKFASGSKAMKPALEESSVKAIQVPFGSLFHAECPESPTLFEPHLHLPERGYQMAKSKDNHHMTPRNLKRKEECTAIVPLKKEHGDTEMYHKRRNDDPIIVSSHRKKRSDRMKMHNMRKRDKNNCTALALIPTKTDILLEPDSPEGGNVRRKHHILWTISEVKQLIDGVSEFGVGRWSRIKKLFFPSSAHRTSVDLKDKWRNLLKASGLTMGKANHKGKGKRSLAWRPLPKSILRRVCELAAVHPYPKGPKQKLPMIKYIPNASSSPDRSTDITLNDYRRILKSIDGNCEG